MRTSLILTLAALSILAGCFDSRRITTPRDGGRPPAGDAGGCGTLTDCLGVCVDVTSDAINCGECGLVCADGQACSASACLACTPSCEGVECGDDGCGGSCGSCAAGESCVDGFCEGGCTPECGGAECGSDGCGGTCGTCPFGTVCSGSLCEETCTPDCGDAECGGDGCGGSCGTCPFGTVCSGSFCEDTCTPDCFGRACGDDGCGGSCGTCGTGMTCSAGTCTSTTGSGESCSSPTAIASTGGSYSFSFTGRVANHTPLSCGSTTGQPDVAFRFSPARSGTATFTARSTTIDTVMAVYTSSCTSPSSMCNDDGGGGTDSLITMSVSAGSTYYIVIAPYAGTSSSGTGTLTITAP